MRRKIVWSVGVLIGLLAAGCLTPDGSSDVDDAAASTGSTMGTWCDPSQIDTNAYYFIRNPKNDRQLRMTSTGWVESSATSTEDESVQWKFTRVSGNQFFIDRKGALSDDVRRLSCDWLDPADPESVGYNSYAVGFKKTKTNRRVTWQLDKTSDGRCWLHCLTSAHPVTGDEPYPPVHKTHYGTVGSLFMKKGTFQVLVADSTDGNESWHTRKWSIDAVPTDSVCGNGTIEPGEACDDGGGQPNTCRSDCAGPTACDPWCENHKDGAGNLTTWETRCEWNGCGACEPCTPRPPQATPNLIVILADDLGYNDVGFNGSTEIPTPHIDRIANGGVRFTDGYVSYPVCGPSRAGLLTGRYQNRFGFTANPTVDPNNPVAGLPYDEENAAEVLSKAGYTSMIVGKWHLGSHPDQHPLQRGFDRFFGFLSGGHQYFPWELTLNDLSEVTKKWEWYRTKIMLDYLRVEIDQYLTDALSDEAVGFIDDQAGSAAPFFLYLAYNAPHGPLQATDKYLSRFGHIANTNRRTYAAMVSALDDGVGRVLDALERHGMMNDTLIVFLSDNGGASNNAANNAPLRGYKGSFFEGGIRVPFAMRWSGRIPAGVDYSQPVISLDILATAASLADVTSNQPMDGVNLMPYLTGEKTGAPHQKLMWKNEVYGGLATRSGHIKAIGDDAQATEIYDVAHDIEESSNLRDGMTIEQLNELMDPWKAWDQELEGTAFPLNSRDVWW